MRIRTRIGAAMAGGIVATALLAGCSTGGAAAPAERAAIPDGEPAAAETAELTVAIPFPDVTMYSMYTLATDLGYYKDEGLKVKVITTDNVTAAVASGSAQIGVESAGTVIEAIRNGVGVDLFAGHYCRQNFDFAAQPDVASVKDLDGKPITLAGAPGDPAEAQRSRVLAEEGWDLSTVNAQLVYPGPGSESWTEFFVNGKIQLQPFYGDDRPALEKAGAKFIVQTLRNWANDVQITSDSFAKDNPNTLVRFTRATIKATQFMTAPGPGQMPENKDKVLDIYEANDFDVADLRTQDSVWVLDGHLACPNLYFDKAAWDTTIETQKLQPLEFDAGQIAPLLAAQKLLGLDNTEPAELTYP